MAKGHMCPWTLSLAVYLLVVVDILNCRVVVNAAVKDSLSEDAELDPVQRLLQQISSGKKRGDLLIYNRVPKSGSSSMQEYVDVLSKQLNYGAVHFVLPPGLICPESALPCLHNNSHVTHPDPRDLKALISHLASLPVKQKNSKRTLVDYHFRFVNFSAAGEAQPVYMNTVRDPVDRIISQYFYARYGPRPMQKKRHVIQSFGELPIEACLQLYRNCSCTGDCTAPEALRCTRGLCQDLYHNFNTQLLHFCTWGSPSCSTKDRTALQEALRNLHEQYDAVGVLEDMATSMQLFEAVLPAYFEGITALGKVSARKNPQKEGPSPEAVQELYRLNALDLEFYQQAVALLKKRHALAVASPARQALREAMRSPA